MLTIARANDMRTPKPERETVVFRLNYGGGRIETLTTGKPPEPVPAPGCSFYYTTAPEAYDGFGTKTIHPDCGRNSNGKTWRMIQVEDRNLNWQDGRNGSGMHPTISVDDFIKYRALYVPDTTTRAGHHRNQQNEESETRGTLDTSRAERNGQTTERSG